jgi:hypothetical protein
MCAMKMGRMEVRAHESPTLCSGAPKGKETLSAVTPKLQLKFQDSEITVTNWDRIR